MNQVTAKNSHLMRENLHCISCPLRKFSLCAELNDHHLEVLDQNKSELYFSKNEYLFKQGIHPFGLYILAEGKVKNARLSDHGFEQIISLNKAVEFLGLYDFMAYQNHSYSAVALEECRVCFIPSKDFMQILSRDNAFAVKLLTHVSRAFSDQLYRMTNLTARHMRGRMADTLLYLYDFFDVSAADDILRIDLKRKDLANMAIMNTSNAVRTLSEFSKKNWITLEKHQIIYRDLTALKHISITQ